MGFAGTARHVVTTAATTLLLAGGAAAWAVGSGPLAGHELVTDTGAVHVVRVGAPAKPGMGMPGMGSDSEPVPDGMRRVTVSVVLEASGRDLTYDAAAFALDPAGAPPPGPLHRADLPGSRLPDGTTIAGSLLFDVPERTTAGVLTYAGRPVADLDLPAEEPGAAHHRASAGG